MASQGYGFAAAFTNEKAESYYFIALQINIQMEQKVGHKIWMKWNEKTKMMKQHDKPTKRTFQWSEKIISKHIPNHFGYHPKLGPFNCNMRLASNTFAKHMSKLWSTKLDKNYLLYGWFS